jgi:TetR/AcrR family tetracycline transcriptional repressor
MAPSIRTRDWHRGLDRGSVTAEALRILDREGREGLTMRRLATALEVEAASLYAHVDSKDDLVDAVLDRVLDEVVLPEPRADARSELVAAFESYRRTLIAHPRVVMLMLDRAHRSASQARLIARSIELLESLGLSTRAAVDAHVTLVAYVLGFIAQEVGRPTTTPAPVAVASPALARALSTLAERSVDERFAVGLALILDGALRSGPPEARHRRPATPRGQPR